MTTTMAPVSAGSVKRSVVIDLTLRAGLLALGVSAGSDIPRPSGNLYADSAIVNETTARGHQVVSVSRRMPADG